MTRLLLALVLASCTHVDRDERGDLRDWSTAPCSACVTDSECEALCIPCTPADADDELGDWTCNRNPQEGAP